MDAFSVYFLFLTVQRVVHNEILCHDIGNRLQSGNAYEDDILLMAHFCKGRFISDSAQIGRFSINHLSQPSGQE